MALFEIFASGLRLELPSTDEARPVPTDTYCSHPPTELPRVGVLPPPINRHPQMFMAGGVKSNPHLPCPHRVLSLGDEEEITQVARCGGPLCGSDALIPCITLHQTLTFPSDPVKWECSQWHALWCPEPSVIQGVSL